MDEVRNPIDILETCLADRAHGATMVYSIMTRIEKAVELLKEQQPKVIELLDLYDSEGMQGYIETRKSIRPCFLVHHLQYSAWCYKPGTPGVNLHKMGIMDTSSLKRFWEFRLYNKTWRIWTARPTEEQRKAVPWETH